MTVEHLTWISRVLLPSPHPSSPSYLIAPSVSPRVTNFCMAVASNTTGTATITAPAAIWVHLMVTSPVYWVKKIGQVALLYPVITSA